MSAGQERIATLANTAKGSTRLLGPALVICLAAFLYALTVPLLATRAFLSHNEIVLLRIAYDLFYFDKFLFVIVVVFGMIFPSVKMIVSIMCWYWFDAAAAQRYNKKLFFLAKLSMLDIMLLALVVIIFKGMNIGTVRIVYGLYFYASVVVASILLNLAIDSCLRRLGTAERATES
jgi:uncharacterized paraquat-inducible protein A